MIRSLVLILALAAPVPALAHNMISSVFPSGSDIEGEIGFSSGDMATDLLVEVFDEAGNKLGETKTDADGFFIFTPTQPVTHIFRGDLGAGHVAEVFMPAADVAALMGQEAAASTASASVSTPAASGAPLVGLSDQARAELATMLRTELRPLRQELSAYKNKRRIFPVCSGRALGYIVGPVRSGLLHRGAPQDGGR